MYDAHKIYDKKIIEYVIFEKEEKYKYIFSISDPYSNTLKKKKSFEFHPIVSQLLEGEMESAFDFP